MADSPGLFHELRDRLTERLEQSWRADRPITFLRPLGFLYGLGAASRRALYGTVLKPARAERPVVSIGNLTVGGSGKTPMALALARLLLERHQRPAILSRGYGRRESDEYRPPLIVSRGAGPELAPEIAGDEPWLMADSLRGLAVVVDADRARGARAAVALGADILILDDGFQHLKLAADCRLLMLPAHRPFGNGAVLPAGPLREPVRTHRLADILVVAGAASPTPEALALADSRPVFAAEYKPLGWQALGGGGLKALESLAGRPVFAFCGLGRPDSFQRTLTALGADLRRFVALRDHQVYDRAALSRLGLDFLASRAEVMVTTAKDAVKLPPAFPLPVKVLKMELVLDRPDELAAAVVQTARQRFS